MILRTTVVAGFALSSLIGLSVAAEATSVQEWFSLLVADRGVKISRDESYGVHPRQKLDVYTPIIPCPDGPIVVFVYGGSWKRGHKGSYAFAGAALAAQGVTTVIPDYRLYPDVRFPDFVVDAAHAYRWTVKSLAAPEGKPPRPIFLMGHSAGAHTAALLAFDTSYLAGIDHKPAGFIGMSGPYAFDPTTWDSTKAIFATAKTADSARPVTFARAGAPPSLLLHGADDTTVKQFNYQELATALKAVGTPVKTKLYPGVGHPGLVLSLAGPLRWRAPTLTDILDFIDQHAGSSKRCRPTK
jgi:acetyl esterase/lipase